MNITDQLTDLELYWLDILKKDEEMLDLLIDKKDRYITDRFVNFMKLMIKYGNLKDTDIENGSRFRRVIRIHKNIPTKYLDYTKTEYIIFNGLYIVSDVMFFDKDIIDKCNRSSNKSILIENNIPLDSLYYVPRDIIINGKKMSVFPIKDDITSKYVIFQSNWSYPTFRKNEGI